MNQKHNDYSITDVLSNRQPDEVVIVQCQLKNLEKAGGSAITAQLIEEYLNTEMRYIDAQFQILRVDISNKSANKITNIAQLSTGKENQFTTVKFLRDILDLDNNPQILMDAETDIEYDAESDQEQSPSISEKFERIRNILTLLMQVIHIKDVVQRYKLQEELLIQLQSSNKKDANKQVTVLLQMPVSSIKKFHQTKITLITGKEPMFLNFAKATEIPKNKEYNIKLGKENIQIESFSIGQFQQIPSDKGIVYEYFNYFNYDSLSQVMNINNMAPLRPQMYYHKDNAILQRKIDIILNFKDQMLLKAEIDLSLCQFVAEVQNKNKIHLYFKLLSPPNYQISFNGVTKYEKVQIRNDWLRIDNIFLNYLQQQSLISETQRLILINNTVICVVINSEFTNQQEFLYQALKNKLLEFRLLQPNAEFQIINENQSIGIDLTMNTLERSKLPFPVQYNILAAISQNKFNDQATINKLIILLQNNQKTTKEHIATQEQAFLQFLKIASNVNTSINQQQINNINLKIFQVRLKQAQEEIIEPVTVDPRLTFVRRISLTPSGLLYFGKLPEETSAVIRKHLPIIDSFLRVHYEDENQDSIINIPYVSACFYQGMICPFLNVLNRQYQLLTWSASQLRSGSCWFFDPVSSKQSRSQVIQSIGNFNTLNLRETAKNAARLGQNLSSSSSFKFSGQLKIQIVKDLIDAEGKLYTDGIGSISQTLIDQIRKYTGMPQLSALQIRYEGAKGVLVGRSDIGDGVIMLRESMVKFNPNKNEYGQALEILDYNKFRGGYLNRQIIILLLTLGIPNQVFIDLQNVYLKSIEDIQHIDSSIYKYFNVEYESELQGISSIVPIIRNMMNGGQNQSNNFFIEGVLNRLRMRGLLQLRTKCNILVEKAARVLGVVDEYGILNEDEVYCIVSIDGESRESLQTESGNVMITRNPCLHPGDIRKLKLATDQEVKQRNNGVNPYDQLVNCVVFPQKGKAIPCQVGGGDLDGDIYFITWDDRLIPPETHKPMTYDVKVKKVNTTFAERNQGYHSNDVQRFFNIPEMVEFMFKYMNSNVLGQIDNSHLAQADQSPTLAKDPICLDLAELHSEAVDFVKHGRQVYVDQKLLAKKWPDYMEKSSKLEQYESKTVLGELYRQVVNICKGIQDAQPIWTRGYECEGLPHIQTAFIYGYNELQTLNIGKVEDLQQSQQDSEQEVNEAVRLFIDKHYKSVIPRVLKCIYYMFESIEGIKKMYNINSEYEIYSGSYTNFTKGDGLYFKRKLNVENVQKRVIQYLVVLKRDIHNILQLQQDQLDKISLLHLILSYSPKSHEYSSESLLGQFIAQLLITLESNSQWSRLKSVFTMWYRGCSWYFFSEQLLSMLQQPEDEML